MQVLIGGEGTWEELRHFSVVLARYGTPGLATGTLGVLGPMRMSYARTIPTVRFVAGLLFDRVLVNRMRADCILPMTCLRGRYPVLRMRRALALQNWRRAGSLAGILRPFIDNCAGLG